MEVIDVVQKQVDAQKFSTPNVRTISMSDPAAVHSQPDTEPAPPPEDKGEPVEKPETNGEVVDATSNLMERLGYKKPDEPSDPPPEPEEPKEKPKGEPKEEPATKKKRGRPRKDSISADDIKGIVKETASAVLEASRQPQAEPEPAADVEIEELNRSDLEVFAELEASDPKYKGIRDKYKSYLTDLAGYKRAWAKENPGIEFNSEDGEHEEWVNGRMPEFDDRDFDNARIESRARKLVRESEGRHREELNAIKSEVAEGNMRGELEGGTNNSIAEVVQSVDSGYLKLIQDKGGEALEAADPIAHHVLNDILGSNEKAIYELEKLAHPSNKFGIDLNNETHKELIDYAMKKEKEISALPDSQKSHEGKSFATTEEWMRMPEARRSSHWRLEPEHIKTMYVGDLGQQASERVKSERERFDAYMNKSGGKKTSQTRATQQPFAPVRQQKPQPPITSGEPVSSTAGGDPGKVNLNGHENLKKYLWG